jgi:hypothetical protein
MQTGARPARIVAVTGPHQDPAAGRDRLVVDIDRNSDPISGVIRRREETERPFTGWLQLIALLDVARGRARDAQD